MSYVHNNLIQGETVLHQARLHWFIYVPSAVCLLVGIGILIAGAEGAQALGMVFILASAWLGLKALIAVWSVEMAITNKRVIVKTGLISRSTLELNHAKIESYQVDQSILGRLLGFGDLIIVGTGATHEPIRMIDDPLLFRRKAIEIMDVLQDPQRRV